jgi:NSS family neurotransmitter:Na+ symporter
MPLLILILLYGALRSLSLPGAGSSLAFLTQLDGQLLTSGKLWLAGYTQSAWSTGAGWGLMLAYAVYAREKDNPSAIPVATGFGNNAIEVLVGLMIFPAVFSLFGSEAVAFVASAGSTGGVAFEATPLIFSQLSGGAVVLALFFLALAFAALTSLVAMVELGARLFMDFGLSRGRALLWALGLGLVLGLPSALHPPFFDNQDFVWGLGLMLSGLFLCVLVWRVGPGTFQVRYLGRREGSRLFTALMALVTVETVLLLGWWLVQERDGITGQCLLQWGSVILALLLFDRMGKKGP